MKQIRLVILSVLIITSVFASAQILDRDIYKAEIGLNIGGSYYLGDANSQLFNNTQLAYGGFFRYVLNTRIAFRAELMFTNVAGVGFKTNNVNTGDLCAEYNFFDLENNPYKRFSKTFSPYIFTGIGLMTGVYSGQTLPEFSLPFGLGLKVKLGNRWNLNAQWSNKLLMSIIKSKDGLNEIPIYHSDNLEGTKAIAPYDKLNNYNGLNGNNALNNDLLSTVTVGLSYDIWKKKCDCLNSNSR